MPLPSTSVIQSGAKDSVEPSNDGHVDNTEQVVQSDDVDVVEECAFSSTHTFALRSADVMIFYFGINIEAVLLKYIQYYSKVWGKICNVFFK